jgi:hypothetical protein
MSRGGARPGAGRPRRGLDGLVIAAQAQCRLTDEPRKVNGERRDKYSKVGNDERHQQAVHDLETRLRKLEHENAALRGVARTVMMVVNPYASNGKR